MEYQLENMVQHEKICKIGALVKSYVKALGT